MTFDPSLYTMDDEEEEAPTGGAKKIDTSSYTMEDGDTPSLRAPDASLFDRTLGAAYVAASKSPITGRLIRSALGTVPGPLAGVLESDRTRQQEHDERVEAMAQRIEESPNQGFVKISELTGEWGPELAMGGGALTAGKKLAVGGLQKVAPQLAGKSTLGKEFARVAFKSLEDAGELFPRAVPKLQQAVEVLGEAAGLGGFVGVEDYIDNGDIPAALRDAAFTFALTVPTAGLIRGVGKIPRKGRERNALEAYRGTSRGEFKATTQAAKDELAGKAEQSVERIKKILKVEEHAEAAAEVGAGGYTRTFTTGQLKSAKKARTKLRQERQALRSYTKLVEHEPLPTNIMGGPRPEPGAVWEGFQKFLVKGLRTPESYFGQFGKTFAAFGEKIGKAEALSIQGESAAEAMGHQIADQAGRALGLAKLPKNGQFLAPVVDAYELGGLPGVRAYMEQVRPAGADLMEKVFQQVEYSLSDYGRLAQMGAEPVMGAKELAGLGVKNYWPQLMKRLTDPQLEARLIKTNMREAVKEGKEITIEQARLRAKEAMNSRQAYGFTKSGTIDHNRLFKGTLKQKIANGGPFEEDPILGLVEHLSNVSRRTAYGREFGFKGELGEKIVATIEAETDPHTASVARMMVDHFLNRPYADTAMAKIAENLTALQIGLKLPLSVIANMSQTSVTTGQSGALNTLKGSFKGLKAAIKGADEGSALKAVGLNSAMMGVVGDAFMEQAVPRTPFGNFARYTLKYTGFDFVERYNRFTAGAATQFDIRDTLIKAWKGRLKGSTLDAARRRMGDYGLDLGTMIQKARKAGDINKALTTEELELAIFRGARATQFIPSSTRKPLGWQNREYGRVLTQFKTFGLNYGRFLKDRVLAEAGHGNYKPLVTFLGVSQPTGEFVADINSVLRQRPRPDNGIDRVLDNQSAVGGMGLLTSAYVSSKWGGLGENLLGPTVGGAAAFLQNGWYEVSRQPIVTLAKDLLILGIITEDFIDDYLRAEGSTVDDDYIHYPAIQDLVKESKK